MQNPTIPAPVSPMGGPVSLGSLPLTDLVLIALVMVTGLALWAVWRVYRTRRSSRPTGAGND